MGLRGPKSRTQLAVVRAQPDPNTRRTEIKVPKPPSHLGEPECDLWNAILREYQVDGGAAYAVLRTALEPV
jgi:hypothetical protein